MSNVALRTPGVNPGGADTSTPIKPIIGKTCRDTATCVLAAGFWPIPIYPPGVDLPRGRGPATGKEPYGARWGAERNTVDTLREKFAKHKGMGVGIGLGPGRGPGGSWPIDVEGDGPQAEESRRRFLGDQRPPTLGWPSSRGWHEIYIVDTARMMALIDRLSGFEQKNATSPGVYHFPEYPDLEVRIGGYRPDGAVKQIQSVLPPTVGTDGKPREWNGISVVAPAPESFYAALEAAAAPKPKIFSPAADTERGQPQAAKTDARWVIEAPAHNANEIAWGEATVRALADKIRATQEGNRRNVLRDASFQCGGEFHLGYHNEAWVVAELRDAGLATGLSQQEVDDTIRDAVEDGRKQPRPLPDKLAEARAERAKGGSVGSVGESPQEIPKFEGDPRPLSVDLLPVIKFVADLLPAPLRARVGDIAQRGSFPIEYPATAAVVGAGGVLGRKLNIKPKRHDDSWCVAPNLWGAGVGPPGWQKSPAIEEALADVKRLAAQAMEAHEFAMSRAREDQFIVEARAAVAKKKLAELVKKGAAEAEIRQAAVEAAAGDVEAEGPKLRRYIVNDSTVEKLGELLQENPNGLIQFRDELTGFLRMMDRQGHESDRGFYLETWNGNGSYTFDRIGRGTVHVKNLCLSLFGTIQPGPLARYIRASASGEGADGFIPRFQLMVYPDAAATFVNVDRKPDKAAKERAFQVYQWLDSMSPGVLGAEYDSDRDTHFLRFSDDAQGLFDEWRTDLENRLRSGSESPLFLSHLSKFRSLLPSLALIFHAVDQMGVNKLDPVSLEATQRAAAWCDLLESHAKRIYQCATEGDAESATRLGERIKQSLPNPFRYRDVVVKGWSGLDTTEDVRRAVNILEGRNWVKVVERPAKASANGGGRPSEEVWINPALQQRKGDL